MPLRVHWKDAGNGGYGITVREAASVLGDPLSRTIADPAAPDFDRSAFVTIGLSYRARTLIVSHLDHGETVRILGARRAIRLDDWSRTSEPEYDFTAGVRGKYAAAYWEAAAAGQLLADRPPPGSPPVDAAGGADIESRYR